MCLVSKRFVKIAELKQRFASKNKIVHNPTRVEAITSFIWKCATKASPSAMTLAVDLRRRSQLMWNMIGNLLAVVTVAEGPESEMEICELVAKIRRKKEEVREKIKENLQGGGQGKGEDEGSGCENAVGNNGGSGNIRYN
ncbi:PREDICTED: BAHD acyltransferase At5g47980-like [Tarenaya hassleriana]|uniref:BAHD acyltransferase At5g47980-like n=1 Tax=Tarenaya hassleriana TaxID=28532 RepID=UPI00053C568B|nr:PREDICTED: BAHD acyltransferase At5g47980-like [Tarenaya hassleriana]